MAKKGQPPSQNYPDALSFVLWLLEKPSVVLFRFLCSEHHTTVKLGVEERCVFLLHMGEG